MANNNAISYWNSVTNTYSDSLPNPDVVTAPIFNDMNRGLMELKWRNSVQRTLTNSDIYTAYGSTVPSGSVLMHECVDITFLDMATTSDKRKHIVRFHLIKGNQEQIITYRSTYDPAVAAAVIDVDWGSDMFPITVQTASNQNGATNKLKIEMQATANDSAEFAYWIETNAPIQTIFDAKNTARNSSSQSQWSNLASILAGTLGTNKGLYADLYKGTILGYQREYYSLGKTLWKFVEGNSTASMEGTTQGSYLTVGTVDANNIDTNSLTVNTTLDVVGDAYFDSITVSGSFTTANVTNDNIYLGNVYSKVTNGAITFRDIPIFTEGFSATGNSLIIGNLAVTGTVDTTTLEADTIKCPSIQSGTLFVPVTFSSPIDMGGNAVSTTGIMQFGKSRAKESVVINSASSPTSLSESRVLINGVNVDLRNCANTAGDIYYLCCKRTSGGADPAITIKYPYNVSGSILEGSISPMNGGGIITLIGTGTTGVFYYAEPG